MAIATMAWSLPAAAQTALGTGLTPNLRTTIEPGIRTSVLWSDNIDLAPSPAARSGTILEVTPYVLARFDSPKLFGNLYYGLRGQWRSGSVNSNDDVRHELRAAGDLALSDEWLRLSGRANAYQVNLSPFDRTSIDAGQQTRNTTFYRDFELSPYARGRLGGAAEYELRYRIRHIEPGSNLPSNLSQRVSSSLQSGRDVRPFSLSWQGEVYRVRYENDFGYDGAYTDLLGWWTANSQLRLGIGANYARNDILFDSDGNNSGWGPSAGIEWFPDQRTSLTGRVSNTYFGNVTTINARHRANAWTFGLGYARDLTQGSDLSGQYFDPNQLFRTGPAGGAMTGTGLNSQSFLSSIGSSTAGAGNPVAQTLAGRDVLSGPGSQLGGGLLQSPLIFNRSLLASIGWVGTRNSALVTGWFSNRRTATPTIFAPLGEDLDQKGVGLRLARRLDQRNTVGFNADYIESESNVIVARSRLSSASVQFAHLLTPKATATFALRHSQQDATGAAVSYDESAVIVSLDYRF